MADTTKLFGMPAEKGRWIYVILGLTINLCLGSVYSYSIFKPFVEKEFGVKAFMGNLPFMIFLASFAILMFFGGRIMEKLGAKKLAIIGGIIVGLGWALSSVTKNIYMLTLTYGVIAGGGVGLTYGVPVAMGARWFPDRKGLAVGLMLAGFGGSALITGNIANKLIPSVGLFTTFLYFGIAFAIILVILALPFKFPQAGWKPQGWTPAAGTVAAVDLDASAMVKTASFWGLFLCFLIGSIAGLMAIGISKPVGNEMILIAGGTAAMLVGIFAIFNAIGRPLFGALTDKIAPKWAVVINLVIILTVSIFMLATTESSMVINKELVNEKNGKTFFKAVTVIDKDGKVDVKKGCFVLKENNVDIIGNEICVKEGTLVKKGDDLHLKSPALVQIIEKDSNIEIKKGAVILKEKDLTIVKYQSSVWLYIIGFVGFWLCLGGWLAIAPATTATFFGMKNYARNYGTVFFAYGIGAILGGIISGFAKDLFGSYKWAFLPTAGLAALGILIALALIKPPKK
jgi:OFA family oxalate/formate antiporter-like MFS transporter